MSRSQYPKQVLHLLGSGSLLQTTIERLLPLIPLERLGVVTSTAQADIIKLDLTGTVGMTSSFGWSLKAATPPLRVALAAAFLETEVESTILGFSQRITTFRTMRDFLRLWSKAQIWPRLVIS